MKQMLIVLAVLVLAVLACRKSTPCDIDPSACVGTGTPAIIMQIVKDTPTPAVTPTPPASLSATPPPAATPTATAQTTGSGKWMEIP